MWGSDLVPLAIDDRQVGGILGQEDAQIANVVEQHGDHRL